MRYHNGLTFPCAAWVRHYDRDISYVTVLGYDWYDQVMSDRPRGTVYIQFSDGLICGMQIEDVYMELLDLLTVEREVAETHVRRLTDEMDKYSRRVKTYTERIIDLRQGAEPC